MKMYCNTNQFPILTFCGPHPKPNGARGLSKHHHLRFDTKLGNGICDISSFHVPVLHVHKCLINLGFMVYLKKNYATKLSQIVLTGQSWAHKKIGISSSSSSSYRLASMS